MTAFALGLEVLLTDAAAAAALADARLGLLLNQASVDGAFVAAHERIAARFPGQLRALFGPQHGLMSEQQDNMIETPHGREPRLGLPVYSLYADRRRPTPPMLADIDVLLVDLQDVGCRVYTYVWTLMLCMQACAEAGVRVLVLDRPNPLPGTAVEGPDLDRGFTSFVGGWPIPLRHDLTLGELARLLDREIGIGCDLAVVAMRGYRAGDGWSAATRRPWLPPSPNLPRREGVDVYAGQVLLEGTVLSEGRGTTTPFEACGAPFVDGYRLRDQLAEVALPGVAFRPIRFEPTFQKWHGHSCGGVFVHVTDAAAFRPVRTTVALLAAIRRQAPRDFAWRPPPYEYEAVKAPIDILSGSPLLREAIDAGAEPAHAAGLAATDTEAWARRAAPHRLYPPGGPAGG